MVDPSIASNGSAAKRVLIVLMPWAPPHFPGLGATLIQTILNRDGIGCDMCYGNLVFHKLLGSDYGNESQLPKLPVSELAFTPYYFPVSIDDAAEQLLKGVLPYALEKTQHHVEQYRSVIEIAGTCLDTLYQSIDWQLYDVVGFSVMMQQTVPSLALAKRIKAHHPHIHILFGGSNCAYPMGDEILRSFPEVDSIVEGEADNAIGPLIHEIRRCPEGPFTVPGVRYRNRAGEVVLTSPAVTVQDMDSLPLPDYTSYFAHIDELQLNYFQPLLQLEMARGCWWGEKQHCTFCSLEDDLMKFRSKSEDRVMEEILTIASKHKYTEFFPSDSIINHRFFRTLLPRLGNLRVEQGYDFAFFFESKSNLRREQVQALRYAGVGSIQPGLESFSDHILSLMRKGTTGIRQLQCLKLLAECGVEAIWNWIYRNPNEHTEDYRTMLDVVPCLYHLPPIHGDGYTAMILLRHSPYFLAPEEHGISDIRPMTFYKDVFPDPGIDLHRLAFYFDYDHADHHNEEMKALHMELGAAIIKWRNRYREDSLLQYRGPGFLRIVDRRDFEDRPYDQGEEITVLTGARAELFIYCDEIRTRKELLNAFQAKLTQDEILTFLDSMASKRLLYRSPSEQFLNLPLLKQARDAFTPPESAGRSLQSDPGIASQLRLTVRRNDEAPVGSGR
jgi:ribosomal peptide maturation radical SAM protein 1